MDYYEYYKSHSHTRLIPWLQLRLEEPSVTNVDKTVSFYAKDHLSGSFALAGVVLKQRKHFFTFIRLVT